MKNKIQDEIISYLPESIKVFIEKFLDDVTNKAKEIRLRANQPILINLFDGELKIEHIVSSDEIIRTLENFSDNSIYAVQNDINSGFITIRGGHRIGIVGTSVFENGKIKSIKYISSLNIRIAREIKDASYFLVKKISTNGFENTILLSPPGCGKTTLIRDMIRQLSNGINGDRFYTISLIDERSEIAALYKGVPQNDIGIRTDVMNDCKKSVGIKLMVRSMNPDIIATDEIGKDDDIDAILDASTLGVKILATAHGNTLKDIPRKLMDKKIFSNIIFLKKEKMPGIIEKIYKLEDKKYVINS